MPLTAPRAGRPERAEQPERAGRAERAGTSQGTAVRCAPVEDDEQPVRRCVHHRRRTALHTRVPRAPCACRRGAGLLRDGPLHRHRDGHVAAGLPPDSRWARLISRRCVCVAPARAPRRSEPTNSSKLRSRRRPPRWTRSRPRQPLSGRFWAALYQRARRCKSIWSAGSSPRRWPG